MPARSHRLAVAAVIATAAAFLVYLEPLRGGEASDFGQVWFGASALLRGGNPYHLIGPNRVFHLDFPLLYPLTASVAVLPLGLLPEIPATVIFVWVSTALLVYAVTRNGWHLMPMFLSSAFVFAVRRAQWSPLLTAAYCLPWMGWVLAAKPNIGIAIFASAVSSKMLKFAIAGGIALGVVGLVFVPTWPMDWLAQLSEAGHTAAPVAQRGGFVILLALLRWKRPEARMLVALSCVPHSMYWYDILPLMLIPATLRESLAFALVSTTGLALEQVLIARATDDLALFRDFNAVMVAVAYLPATIMVLRRPNTGTDWLLRDVDLVRRATRFRHKI